ncbi:hypothetical protein FOA52_009507 [Chlamydomonas sp. UWO 241]|nr:hypothetical protein FOA52_009507 [Chlamydomonas sp. UWO 241]
MWAAASASCCLPDGSLLGSAAASVAPPAADFSSLIAWDGQLQPSCRASGGERSLPLAQASRIAQLQAMAEAAAAGGGDGDVICIDDDAGGVAPSLLSDPRNYEEFYLGCVDSVDGTAAAAAAAPPAAAPPAAAAAPSHAQPHALHVAPAVSAPVPVSVSVSSAREAAAGRLRALREELSSARALVASLEAMVAEVEGEVRALGSGGGGRGGMGVGGGGVGGQQQQAQAQRQQAQPQAQQAQQQQQQQRPHPQAQQQQQQQRPEARGVRPAQDRSGGGAWERPGLVAVASTQAAAPGGAWGDAPTQVVGTRGIGAGSGVGRSGGGGNQEERCFATELIELLDD